MGNTPTAELISVHADVMAARNAPTRTATYTGRVLNFDLATMTDDARASWLAVYELGVRDGWGRGYQAAEDDMATQWRRAHAVVQQAAKHPTHDELTARRARRVEMFLDGERPVGA